MCDVRCQRHGIAFKFFELYNYSIRGTLTALFDTFLNLGVISAFVLSKYFDYVAQAKYNLILPIAFVILFAKIPDSPQHLMQIRREKV